MRLRATQASSPAQHPPGQRSASPVAIVDDRLNMLQRHFKELHAAMMPPMLNLAAHSLGSRERAEEVYQHVMAEFWTKLESGELTPDRLTRKLVATAVRLRTLNAVREDDGLETLTEEHERHGMVSVARWSDIDSVNVKGTLDEVLSQLTPPQRTAWLLDHAGYTRKEIAEAMGVSPETAKSHVKTSNRRVREGMVAAGWDEYAQYLERRYTALALQAGAEGQSGESND